MKILLITAFWGHNDGGLALSCKNFAEMLVSHDNLVYVIASPDEDESKSKTLELREKSGTPNLIFMKDTTTLVTGGYREDIPFHIRFAVFSRHIVAEFAGCKPDVCIAFGAGANGLLAAHISHELNIPLLVSLRGSEINLSLSNILLRLSNQICLNQAAVVVGLSQELVSRAKEIAPSTAARFYVIPKEFNLPNPSLKPKLIEGSPPTITLGIGSRYLNEKKGVGMAIRILGHLNRKYVQVNWKLDLAGQIDSDLEDKYRALVKSENLEESVSFLGLLNRDQWQSRAKKWHASMQSSYFEGFSNSNIEAWNAGVPVLFTDTGYLAEQLRGPIPELILPINSEEAAADKIGTLFFENVVAELSNKAIELLRPLLDQQTVWKNWENILLNISTPVKKSTENTKQDWTLSVLFHDISETEYSSVSLPENQFSLFLEKIREKGYKLCSAADYQNSIYNKEKCIICTFDDGYEGVYKYAFPIMKEYDFTATVFVVTQYIGRENNWNPRDTINRIHMDEQQLMELNLNGWEIGSHGLDHKSMIRLNHGEIIQCFKQSKEILSIKFGEISSFAYPYGHHNEFVRKEVNEYYDYAFATDNGGSHWRLDRDRVRRYSPSEILDILGG